MLKLSVLLVLMGDEGGVGRRHRGGLHDLRPVEEKEQQKDAHHGKDGVDEDALEEVGDHHRDLAAEEGEGEGDGQQEGHDGGVDEVKAHAEVDDVLRETAVVLEEAAADGRENAEVDNAGNTTHDAGVDSEGAAVAHLEELGHRHGTGLAEAILHPAGGGDDDADGQHHHVPPGGGEAGLVVHFETATC